MKSYLTGIIQEYSVANKLPLENLRLKISFSEKSSDKDPIYKGLFVDLWDTETKKICESKDKNNFVQEKCFGTFRLLVSSEEEQLKEHEYMCPLFLTPSRDGDLSLQGTNPNLIRMFPIEFEGTFDTSHWIKRGVAMISQKTEDD